MTDSAFKKQIKYLEAAFRVELSKDTLKIYFQYLKDISDEKWNLIIERAIRHEHKFPSIASLLGQETLSDKYPTL